MVGFFYDYEITYIISCFCVIMVAEKKAYKHCYTKCFIRHEVCACFVHVGV